MSARPNLTKTLVELLKAAGVKASKRGQHALVVDDQPVAQVYDAAKGSIRLFVTDKRGKLPAKLAKPFKLNQTRGYAKRFTIEDDLTPAVEAIAHVASIEVAEKPKPATRKTSAAKPKSERDLLDALILDEKPKPSTRKRASSLKGKGLKPSKSASKTTTSRKRTTSASKKRSTR